jgi:hypothetical protein
MYAFTTVSGELCYVVQTELFPINCIKGDANSNVRRKDSYNGAICCTKEISCQWAQCVDRLVRQEAMNWL